MRHHNEIDGYCGPENLETNEYLRDRHGCGYVGFQTYRLVHSAYLTALSAGEWKDWDSNLPPEMRGRLVADATGKALTADTHAERTVTEMRRCSKYPLLHETPGWILERWMAPAYFGSPTEWESRKVAGTSLPSLGPYPSQGEYIQIAGPYAEAPTGPFLDRLVEYWELMREDVLALAADAYVRKRWYEAEERDKETSVRWNREASQANMTALQSFTSTFLEGGRARQLAAEHAGLQSNYGN